MYNVIYCEFLKIKKSHFYLSLILIVSILPIGLNLLATNGSSLKNSVNYIFLIEKASFNFLTIPLSTLIAAYIFTREFSLKTMSNLFCYPASKLKIFFSKLVFILLLTASLIFFQLFFALLLGSVFNHAELTKNLLLVYLKLNLYHILCLYAILPIAILIALLCKNSIIPFIYSAVVCICNSYMSVFIPMANKNTLGYAFKNNCDYIPIYFPIKILSNFFNQTKDKILIIPNAVPLHNISIFIDLILFIMGTLLCFVYYNFQDIY
ncbi:MULTISPECIES: ABC transporter permease [Clostridium]|uniref:ABC transporter permease n=1 Tax=Clostridium TaxID=1485 RepID=UPI000825A20E|nr:MULTISPECIES: ABC transporter permease [Clostridium]